jgi:hypothetical protein
MNRLDSSRSAATDWTGYYRRGFVASSVTRRITAGRLVAHLRRHAPNARPHIVEWGGGNSCFVQVVYAALAPRRYSALDNNPLGLSLLHARRDEFAGLEVLAADVLEAPAIAVQADIVFSVGLIEHFDPVDTARAIDTHFACVRPGGVVLISFPTPTWLYRATRWCAERLGLWAFPDERPLLFGEVQSAMSRHGTLLAKDLLWPIVLTQGILVFRKAN